MKSKFCHAGSFWHIQWEFIALLSLMQALLTQLLEFTSPRIQFTLYGLLHHSIANLRSCWHVEACVRALCAIRLCRHEFVIGFLREALALAIVPFSGVGCSRLHGVSDELLPSIGGTEASGAYLAAVCVGRRTASEQDHCAPPHSWRVG